MHVYVSLKMVLISFNISIIKYFCEMIFFPPKCWIVEPDYFTNFRGKYSSVYNLSKI